MNPSVLLYPGGDKVIIEELERRLQFTYIAQQRFETEEARLQIWAKGIEKLGRSEVSSREILFGQRFAQQIREEYLPAVSVRWVNEQVGYGLFAEEEIAGGAYVGEYTGLVRENDRRYFEPLNNYCYEYPVLDSLGRSFVIDATQGNLTRFINHSFAPNLQPIYAFVDGFYHCIFRSLRPIRKGSQFSYDYGKSYWYLRNTPEELTEAH